MTIKIDNATDWRTDDLRVFIRAAILADGQDPNDAWRVEIRKRRVTNRCAGLAWIGSHHMVLKIPHRFAFTGSDGRAVYETQPAVMPDFVVHGLGRVTIHELNHCRGLDHADMVDLGSIDTVWAEGLTIRSRSAGPAPEPTASKDEAKLAKLRETLVRTFRFCLRSMSLLCTSRWSSSCRAFTSARGSDSSAPSRSLNTPPASRTITASAAMSRMFTSDSITRSMPPRANARRVPCGA